MIDTEAVFRLSRLLPQETSPAAELAENLRKTVAFVSGLRETELPAEGNRASSPCPLRDDRPEPYPDPEGLLRRAPSSDGAYIRVPQIFKPDTTNRNS